MMSAYMADMTREHIIQPQLCNTQKARKHYHNMIIIHSWDSGITAVINYKITLTAYFSCNSDLFIKAFMTPYHTSQV